MPDLNGLDDTFREKLEKLVAASGGRVTINSAYRSVERQTELWNAAVQKYGSEQAARRWVAPPGKSRHNHGMAADLGGDLELAHQLAPQFGLVFPMSWEPWHIEPPEARGQLGETYHEGDTTPPPGVQHDPDQMKSLSTQMYVFGEILRGKPASEISQKLGMRTGPKGLAQGELSDGNTQAPTGFSKENITGDPNRFLAAVRQHESGGNYQAKNPHGSASGAYQFIDQTWNNFGGFEHAWQAPPEVQDQKAQEYLSSLQNASADDPRIWAAGWYGGPGIAQKLAQGKLEWSYHPGGANPGNLTMGTYADRIVNLMGQG